MEENSSNKGIRHNIVTFVVFSAKDEIFSQKKYY